MRLVASRNLLRVDTKLFGRNVITPTSEFPISHSSHSSKRNIRRTNFDERCIRSAPDSGLAIRKFEKR